MWHQLARGFVRLGHPVTHVSRLCDGLPAEEEIDGVRHVRVKGYDTPGSLVRLKALDLLYSLRVKRVMERSDILVANTFWMPILLRDPARWGRVVVDMQRMPRGQVRWYRHVACLRVNSEAVREAVVRECPAIEPIVRLIPNPLPFEPPELVDWPGKEKVILYAGRVHPEKGLHLLADAWKRLRGEFPEWRVEIAGPHAVSQGGGGESFLRALKERFESDRVVWHGSVHDDAALHALYRKAAVFVYPSVAEKGETFGLAPLEAMAFGAAPVVSALECFRAFLSPRENGAVFNHRAEDPAAALAECMRCLMEDRECRQKVGRAAAERAKAFAPGIVAEQFLEAFKKVSA